MTGLIVDITLMSVVAFFAILGFFTGFTGKVLSLASWVLGGMAAFYTFPHVIDPVRDLMGHSWWVEPLTGFFLYVIYLIIFMLLSKTISNNIKGSKIGFIDRNLGVILGAILGIFFLSIIILGLRFFMNTDTKPDYISDSKIFPLISFCADKICAFVPPSILPPKLIHMQDTIQKNRDHAAWRLSQLTPKGQENETVYAAPERQALDALIEDVS